MKTLIFTLFVTNTIDGYLLPVGNLQAPQLLELVTHLRSFLICGLQASIELVTLTMLIGRRA